VILFIPCDRIALLPVMRLLPLIVILDPCIPDVGVRLVADELMTLNDIWLLLFTETLYVPSARFGTLNLRDVAETAETLFCTETTAFLESTIVTTFGWLLVAKFLPVAVTVESANPEVGDSDERDEEITVSGRLDPTLAVNPSMQVGCTVYVPTVVVAGTVKFPE